MPGLFSRLDSASATHLMSAHSTNDVREISGSPFCLLLSRRVSTFSPDLGPDPDAELRSHGTLDDEAPEPEAPDGHSGLAQNGVTTPRCALTLAGRGEAQGVLPWALRRESAGARLTRPA